MAFAFIFDSVGAGEWLVLFAVLLVVVGPKQLPATARSIARMYSRTRRAADRFFRELTEEADEGKRTLEDAFRIEGDEAETVPEQQ